MKLGIRTIILVCFLFFAVIAILTITFQYFHSFQDVTVRFKNVENVYIVESSFDSEHGSSELLKTSQQHKTFVRNSDQTIRLKRGGYMVSYTGKGNYKTGVVFVSLENKKELVNIDPPYSDKFLETMLNTEFPQIKNVLTQKYKNISLYEIGRGRLYHEGQWYGTTLQYIGNDINNSDTLRVLLKKISNTWVVVTDPPLITISKVNYPDVPKDVLSSLNNVQAAPILERLTKIDTTHLSDEEWVRLYGGQ